MASRAIPLLNVGTIQDQGSAIQQAGRNIMETSDWLLKRDKEQAEYGRKLADERTIQGVLANTNTQPRIEFNNYKQQLEEDFKKGLNAIDETATFESELVQNYDPEKRTKVLKIRKDRETALNALKDEFDARTKQGEIDHITNSKAYSDRVLANLLNSGIDPERATKISKDIYEKNKEPEMTDREKLLFSEQFRSLDSQEAAAKDELERNKQTTTSTTAVGTGTTGTGTGSGSKNDKPASITVNTIKELIDMGGFKAGSDLTSLGDTPDVVLTKFSKLAKSKDFKGIDQDVLATALYNLKEGEAGKVFKFDPKIPGDVAKIKEEALKLQIAKEENKRAGSSKSSTTTSATRHMYLKDAKTAYDKKIADIRRERDVLLGKLGKKGLTPEEYRKGIEEAVNARVAKLFNTGKEPAVTPAVPETTKTPETSEEPVVVKKSEEKPKEVEVKKPEVPKVEKKVVDLKEEEKPKENPKVEVEKSKDDKDYKKLSPEAKDIVDEVKAKEKKFYENREKDEESRSTIKGLTTRQSSLKDAIKRLEDKKDRTVPEAKELLKLRKYLSDVTMMINDERKGMRGRDILSKTSNVETFIRDMFSEVTGNEVDKAAELEAAKHLLRKGSKSKEDFKRNKDLQEEIDKGLDFKSTEKRELTEKQALKEKERGYTELFKDSPKRRMDLKKARDAKKDRILNKYTEKGIKNGVIEKSLPEPPWKKDDRDILNSETKPNTAAKDKDIAKATEIAKVMKASRFHNNEPYYSEADIITELVTKFKNLNTKDIKKLLETIK